MKTMPLFTAFLIVSTAAIPDANRGHQVIQNPTTHEIDRVFADWQSADGPGCAVGVSRDGRVLYEQGYGMANLETATPIRPSTVFHVASVSKQFTAMAIALLARDGQLSIDDPVSKHLPQIPAYRPPITIRHLLTHTSGIRNVGELMELRGYVQGSGVPWGGDGVTDADVLAILSRQRATNFEPGTDWNYSNTGYVVLAALVRRVSGQSLAEFAAERIFKPLGMTHSHFHDDDTMLVPEKASGYGRRGDGWGLRLKSALPNGAGGLFTTVGDLLKWEANFDAARVGDRVMLDEMQTPFRLAGGQLTAYAFGLQIGRYRDARLIGHNGETAGYTSFVGRFPDNGLAVAVLCNAGAQAPPVLARRVADLFLGPGNSAPAPAVSAAPIPENVSSLAPMLRRRAGLYVQSSTQQLIEVAIKDGQLVIAGTPDRALIPVTESRVRVTGQQAELVFGSSERSGFEWRPLSGGRPIHYDWQPPPDVSPSAIAAFVGEYYSDEVEGHCRVTVGSGSILFRFGTASVSPGRPLYLGAFQYAGYVVRFIRTRGRVTGFEITGDGIRGVRFQRVRSVPR